MSNLMFCLMGPTASGKTAIACELVQHFPLDIISVDSAMIYRGMDIGTAKPDALTLARAPHHLIDIRDPTESYSVASFCEDVALLSEAITARGRIPLLVGGTMMYFRALQQGLSTLPQADEQIRAKILQQAKQRGWVYMHEQLAAVDPSTAARLHPHDAQRIQRALEVYQLTKRPLSEFLLAQRASSSHRFINFSLFPDERAWLHQRIAERFKQMLDQGFVAEVEGLCQRWALTLDHPSMRSVGYRQVLEYLQGAYDKAHLMDKGIAATRQVAKRQLTWLRHWPESLSFSAENPATMSEMMAIIREILDNSTF